MRPALAREPPGPAGAPFRPRGRLAPPTRRAHAPSTDQLHAGRGARRHRRLRRLPRHRGDADDHEQRPGERRLRGAARGRASWTSRLARRRIASPPAVLKQQIDRQPLRADRCAGPRRRQVGNEPKGTVIRGQATRRAGRDRDRRGAALHRHPRGRPHPADHRRGRAARRSSPPSLLAVRQANRLASPAHRPRRDRREASAPATRGPGTSGTRCPSWTGSPTCSTPAPSGSAGC